MSKVTKGSPNISCIICDWCHKCYKYGLFARSSWSFSPQKEVKTLAFQYVTKSLMVVMFDWCIVMIWSHQSHSESWIQDTADKLFRQIKEVTAFKVLYFIFIWFCNTVNLFVYQHCQSERHETLVLAIIFPAENQRWYNWNVINFICK